MMSQVTPRRRTCALALASATVLAALPAATQEPAPAPVEPDTTAWPAAPRVLTEAPLIRALGSASEDRARLATLQSDTVPFPLIRSPSARTASVSGTGLRAALLPVEVRVAYNSALPHALNEGALWPARGWGTSAQIGARVDYGRLMLIAAPVLTYAQNEPFAHLLGRDTTRSAFAAPWRSGRYSVDLPLRFGTEPLARLDLGQTTLAVDGGAVAVGLSNEAQWWGPGIRNAIVMSNNAPGVPHLFVRTARPASTRLGEVEATWMLGVLTGSTFFDEELTTSLRTLNGAAATLRPRGEPNLTLGIARAVMARGAAFDDILARLHFGIFRVPAPDTATATFENPDSRPRGDSWQVTSLFGRWAFPEDGLEVYGEWGRHELPRSLRHLLIAPHHTQGYTVGLQWARPVTLEGVHLRLQGEATNLEQAATYRTAPRPAFYASRRVPQGYTHRGRSVGAAIGPGASAQWLAADLLGSGTGGGFFVNRIRWENDAYYQSPMGWAFHAHDVSMILGLRFHTRTRFATLQLEAARENRMNYLFQNPKPGFGRSQAVDVSNGMVRMMLSAPF